ncbi:MAG: class I SAM-dependent methyltransferase [Candidatus Sericytochromatia bacterium]
MDKNNETLQTWNKLAPMYKNKFMDLKLYNDSYDLFCELITKKNPNILEIGCGPANITKYLLSKRSDFSILATDYSPNMIDVALTHNLNATFKVMDCREIKTLEQKYEGIICGFCVPYLSELEVLNLILDCYNLLSEKGILYLSFVDNELENTSEWKTTNEGNRVFFNYYTTTYIKELLINNSFEICDKFEIEQQKPDKKIEKHIILVVNKNC